MSERLRFVLEPLEPRRLLSAGQLDSSFGVGGKVLVTPPAVPIITDTSGGVLQPDGKLVVVGIARPYDKTDLVLARFNADGSADDSFGDQGASYMPLDADARAADTFIPAVTIQGGRILVGETPRYGGDFKIVAFTAVGALDPSFGVGGVVRTHFQGGTAGLEQLSVSADGSITAAGSWVRNHRYAVAVARYDASGAPQSHALTPVPFKPSVEAFAPGGAVFAAGSLPNYHHRSTSIAFVGVSRITAAGRVDSSFGDRGIAYGTYYPTSLLAGRHGSVYVGGVAGPFQLPGGIVVKYTAAGILDPHFGRYGVAQLGFSGASLSSAIYQATDLAPTQLNAVTSMALTPDGSLVTGGAEGYEFGYAGDGSDDLILTRLTPGGALDPAFATNGVARFRLGTDYSAAEGVFVRPDGAIVTPALDASAAYGTPEVPYASLAATASKLGGVQFTRDGTADLTYGILRADGLGAAQPALPAPTFPTAIAAIAGDKILLATFTPNALIGGRLQFYSVDGSPDSDVPGDSGPGTHQQENNVFVELTPRPDGRLLAAGRFLAAGPAADFNVVTQQFQPDGSADPSFPTQTGLGFDTAPGLFAEPDGGVVQLLRVRGAPQITGEDGTELHLVHFDPTGLATSDVTLDQGDSDLNGAAAQAADGSILVTAYESGTLWTVARYGADFSLDRTFGTNGIVTLPSADASNHALIAVQADGKILVASNGLFRLNADGSMDYSFGNGGSASLPSLFYDPTQMLVQADGKIVLCVSYLNADYATEYALIRYDLDGRLDSTFGTAGTLPLDFSLPPVLTLTGDGSLLAAGSPLTAHFPSEQILMEKFQLS